MPLAPNSDFKRYSQPKPGVRQLCQEAVYLENLSPPKPLLPNPKTQSPAPKPLGPEEANLTTSSVGAAAGDEARSGSLPTIGQVCRVMRFRVNGARV